MPPRRTRSTRSVRMPRNSSSVASDFHSRKPIPLTVVVAGSAPSGVVSVAGTGTSMSVSPVVVAAMSAETVS